MCGPLQWCGLSNCLTNYSAGCKTIRHQGGPGSHIALRSGQENFTNISECAAIIDDEVVDDDDNDQKIMIMIMMNVMMIMMMMMMMIR